MLNFKFIRLGWFFVLAFVLFFHNISLALEQQAGAGSLRSLVIKDVKIETSDTEVKISGKLINQSQNIATSKITHLLVLETINPLIKPKNEIDQMPPLIVLAEEGKDYFSLNPNKQKSFSYSLSASKYVPKANYRLSLSFIRSDGKEEASHSEVIINFGSSEKEGFLAFDQQSCVLFSKEGKRLGNNNGPAFLPGESPKISCLIKNIGDKEIEVSPKILWKEVFVYSKPLEGKMAEEKQSEKIFFNPGESKTIALFMPIAEKPQTYQGLLSFEDENGASRSFNTFFRWTISGESARVKSVAQTNQLKDFYDKGDVVLLSVDYFGSSDLYWAGTQAVSNLSDLTMRAVIKDKNGNICGKKEETLPEITEGFSKNKTVEVVLDKKCKGMTYSVSLSSGQKSLTEQSGDLPKFINRQNTLQYFYFGTPAIMILLAFYLFIRKKSVPVYVFIFALAGVAMFSVSVLAETKTFPESGGTVNSWEWGGDWINDGSVVLYSTAHGTGGLNKLRPDKINAQLSGFFINNNDIGSVDVDYFTDDTSCSNTSMEVEYKVLIIADGLGETPLTTKRVTYNANTGYQHEYVSIPPTNIQSLYDNSGIPRKNPKLIVEMKQIGMYGEEEFNYEYKWVGLDLGSYGYNQETEAYYPESGGGYDLVTTANETFYPGLFSSGASDKRTKANAYASSDTIRIEVPLSLPTPTLRLKPLSATINPGQTKQFSVFYDADGPSSGFPEENVTAKIGARGIDNWSSDDATVVKVNEAGLATAVASGSAKIKAIYYRGLNAKVQISVPSFRIRPMKAEITEGYGRQFESLYDEDGWGVFFDEKKITDQSVWISDNPDSATVENKKNILGGKGKGWVSALKKGSANISADYSGLRAVSYVLVKDIPIPLDVSCSVDKNPVLVNEQTAIFTATAVGGTEPYSYSWTGDDGLVGTTDTISKSYSATGTKNATVEVKDKVGAIANSICSVEVKDGTIGECNTVKDQCLIGVLDDITDSATQYLWNCVGTKSTESIAYCSSDKPTNDPSYNVSPDNKELEDGKSWQFAGIYNSDKTGTSADDSDVTNLANWTSSDAIIANITSSGSTGRGLATCLKPSAEDEDIVITSTYKDESSTEFTDTATLSCFATNVPNYFLTVNIVGKGEVFGLIDCDQTKAKCVKEFDEGDSGSITALPDTGYAFSLSGWPISNLNNQPNDCSSSLNNIHIADSDTEDHSNGDNYCDLVINSNKEVTVVFEPDGTIGECNTAEKNKCLVGVVANAREDQTQFLWDCAGTQDTVSCSFDKVSAWITATPLDVYESSVVIVEWGSSENAISCEHLDGGNDSEWKGIGESATSGSFTTSSLGKINRTYTIKCTDNISVAEDSVEIKVIEPKKLTVEVIGDGMTLDSVVISGGEIKLIDCNRDCDEDYVFDSEVTLEAKPKEDFFFGNWKDCDSVDGNQCFLTMDADKKVTATFVKKGEIIITASDITTTIVARLMTKTQTKGLAISGPCVNGTLSLSADYTNKDAGGSFVFDPEGGGSFPYSGNFSVKNIKGTTDAGIYSITLTATCTSQTTEKEIGQTAKINLIIKKILSDWQEI